MLDLKNILKGNERGLILYQSDEEHGLAGLTQIVERLLFLDFELQGVIEDLGPELFNKTTVSVDFKKGIFYPDAIKKINPKPLHIVVVENPRDRETFLSISSLIDKFSCKVISWLRGPSHQTGYAKESLLDLNLSGEYLRYVIHQDFSVEEIEPF